MLRNGLKDVSVNLTTGLIKIAVGEKKHVKSSIVLGKLDNYGGAKVESPTAYRGSKLHLDVKF